MSEIDDKLANSEKQIAEIERQTHRRSLANHPELRERARDTALKKATGRAKGD